LIPCSDDNTWGRCGTVHRGRCVTYAFPDVAGSATPRGVPSRTPLTIGTHRWTGVVRMQFHMFPRPARTVTMLTPDWKETYLSPTLGRYDPIWGKTAGCKRDRRAAPQPPIPSRGTWTGLTEPCGALPRKCLFICLLRPWEGRDVSGGRRGVQESLHHLRVYVTCAAFCRVRSNGIQNSMIV
jgi:hypothetical protein